MNTATIWPIACWMKKAFSLFFICSLNVWACEISRPVVSLSAPITGVLEDLNLLEDKNLVAISSFYPTLKKISKERLGGGLFLSQKSLKRFQKTVIFYDESGEMKRRLKEFAIQEAIEVSTRSLDPFEATERALVQVTKSLRGCEDSVKKLQDFYGQEKKWLLMQPKFPGRWYFFVGYLKEKHWPNLLMVNDGPMLFWLKHQKMQSFDSTLAYVRWGEKWKSTLGKDDHLVGLEHTNEGKVFKWEKAKYLNITSAGALTPGPWQIRFMRQFTEKYLSINQH